MRSLAISCFTAALFCYATAEAQFNPGIPPQHVFYNKTLPQRYFCFSNPASLKTDARVKRCINTTYDSLIGGQGYRLLVGADSILITANTPAGLFYGEQCLLQTTPAANSNNQLQLRPCSVVDYPTYAYRGMHLDVCRHFFSKEVIKKYIDELAANRINYFHWHLTDDQGWRIEIEKYPLLTQVGAWRTEKDGTRYGGYYSQQDIKEIVAYAAAKYITIIPEIEMPGHSSAAIAAYPWLGCTGTGIAVPNGWGIFKDIYCPTDSTFMFMRDVLDEVCALFPSPYIHLGGDEAPKQQWKHSPLVQQLKKKQHMKNYEEVQHYFLQQMEAYLAGKGKRTIGWGEIIRGGVSDSTVVMSWRGRAAGIRAAKKGNQVIMAPRFSCYFDYPQSRSEKKPAWWMTYLPLKKVYHFNPSRSKAAWSKNIIGGEATLWTEYVYNESQLWRQLKPRLAAMGVALWGTNKYWYSFQMQHHLKPRRKIKKP